MSECMLMCLALCISLIIASCKIIRLIWMRVACFTSFTTEHYPDIFAVYLYMHAYIYFCIYAYIYTLICVYMYIYINTCRMLYQFNPMMQRNENDNL